MKRLFLSFIFMLCTAVAVANEPQIDTLIEVDGVSVSTIKQGINLHGEPIATTIISAKEVERKGITAIKDISQIVPNLHIPDYGSRTTSSIYIRGLGARIDQPVMGLNIDNVPYLNKNGFDTEVMDIERIEVLRGPQSTLYGRNTMGGVMNIYTLSPFNYQGIRAGAEYSSGNSYKFRSSLYNRHSDSFASAASLYYSSTDGFFENNYTGTLCDWEQSAGGRLKLSYRGTNGLRVENTSAASMTVQGGYAYRLIESEEVNYNEPASYERETFSNGTTVKYQGANYSLASILSYQYITDDMYFDNDFTADDYFTLQQAINEHSVTEDLLFRSEHDSPYNFLFGAFGFYKHQQMNAPVTFREFGINNLILENANKYFAPLSFVWDTPEFELNSRFTNRTSGAALYHESSFETERWTINAGARLDYEKASLFYHNFTESSCSIYDENNEFYDTKEININNKDISKLHFLEFLPKINATYRIGSHLQSSIYVSAAKGYKAGGFNTQMFSDILQQRVMKEFGVSDDSTYDTSEIISYEPEHSWNYEIGAHLMSPNRKFSSDLTLFYIDCRNQQLTVFPAGKTTGRMMTNAGRSRSFGVEAAIAASPCERISISGSYGYTNAKFVKYISGNNNFANKFVPYSPQHTLFAEVSYTQPLRWSWAERISVDINNHGVGRIYWNEENSRYQPFYSLLGSTIRIESKKYTVSLWAKNILQEDYNTFYFMSMSNEFVQSGRPRTIGATFTINI